jgi:hypothetical protein
MVARWGARLARVDDDGTSVAYDIDVCLHISVCLFGGTLAFV